MERKRPDRSFDQQVRKLQKDLGLGRGKANNTWLRELISRGGFSPETIEIARRVDEQKQRESASNN